MFLLSQSRRNHVSRASIPSGGGDHRVDGAEGSGFARLAIPHRRKRSRLVYRYVLGYEVGTGERLQSVLPSVRNIHEAIKEVRKEHPDAHMFTVVNKRYLNPLQGVFQSGNGTSSL